MRKHLRLIGAGVAIVTVIATSQFMCAETKNLVGAGKQSKNAERRPYCEGWPKPDFVLFITGRQHGYIEPCGCTGLDSQKGGLARRQTLYRELLAKGWDVIPIDVGNQVRRFGRQPAIKFQTTIAALKEMNYQAVGLGPDDFRLEVGELISEIVDQTPLVCSNVSIVGLPISDGHKIVTAGKHKIGITAILGEKEQKGIRSDDLEFLKPLDGINQVHKKFVEQKCDLMVLLSHASTEETVRIAAANNATKDFRVVITAGGADEPALQPERIKGTRSYLVQTGKKGMYVGVLGIFSSGDQPMRYERIPLDSRFTDSKEMLQSLANYQSQLEVLYKRDWEALGLRPVQHPNGNFVGSEACRDCHDAAVEKWENTPHHKATASIAFPGERSSIPRHFDPECLSCHVTGWEPQDYFPYKTGYVDFEKSKLLHGNGCENCHGPGSQHVAAENGDLEVDDDQLELLRKRMQLPLDKAQENCLKCHDLDNDPHFQEDGAFEKYWKQIEHYE